MKTKTKLILAGGSGFLGKILARHFQALDYEVVILSRQKEFMIAEARTVYWDGQTLGNWQDELEDSFAVINLAGRTVDCRYNQRNKAQIIDSRLRSTAILAQAIETCELPPELWLNLSTATIYEHSYAAEGHTEASDRLFGNVEAKDFFSVEVARLWEAEFLRADLLQTRRVLLRSAIVFGAERGTVLDVIRRMSKLGLGAKMGHGRQLVSWISGADFCRSVEFILNLQRDSKTPAKVYNLAAPQPVTNKAMMKAFRQLTGAKFALPAPKFCLEIGAFFLRTETELIIKSRNVLPRALSDQGFEFEDTDFEKMIGAALDQLAAEGNNV